MLVLVFVLIIAESVAQNNITLIKNFYNTVKSDHTAVVS